MSPLEHINSILLSEIHILATFFVDIRPAVVFLLHSACWFERMHVKEILESSWLIVCIASYGEHDPCFVVALGLVHKVNYVVKQVFNSTSLVVERCWPGSWHFKVERTKQIKSGVVWSLKKTARGTKCKWMMQMTYNKLEVHMDFLIYGVFLYTLLGLWKYPHIVYMRIHPERLLK